MNSTSELLAKFLDWLIENPDRFKPNKPSIMLADEFLKQTMPTNNITQNRLLEIFSDEGEYRRFAERVNYVISNK